MTQFGQFLINHWILWLTFLLILILIFINEYISQKRSSKSISPQTAVDLINHDDAIVVDLREIANFQKGHIINAISKTTFANYKIDDYKNKPVILVCERGWESAQFAIKLRRQGVIRPLVLAGGLAAWQAQDFPLTKGTKGKISTKVK